MRIIVGLLTFCFGVAAIQAADRPNIVFVMADDMGYGDMRANNPESSLATPNLDRLSKQGMRFTDAHTPSAVCTPTRYGVVTGRYCWRSRLKRGVQNGYGPPLIEEDRMTVAAFLKGHGYHTGIVGKWHLGLGFSQGAGDAEFDFTKPVSHGPHVLGFDFSHIIPASLDFPPYVYIRDGKISEFPSLTQPAQSFPAYLRRGERSPDFVMEDCLDDLLRVAVDYIGRRAKEKEPFFLYFPLTAPHKPVLPHSRFHGQTKLGRYGDFVTQVDWTVGQVMKALEENEVADNTLLIYTSDNGSFMHRLDDADAKGHVDDESIQSYRADRHRANGVFRGTKADIWEAGHRVPFVVRWPKSIAPSTTCDSTICLTDFFATAADVVAAKIPEGVAADSYSFLPLLKGEKLKTPRAPVIHHSSAGMFAIRDGQWKLVLGNGSGGRAQPKGKVDQKPYALFNMLRDKEEQHDVVSQYPDVAKRLEAAAMSIRENEGNIR